MKFLLLDGNSILFRSFYALPLLSTSTGLYTNAVYGFTMMLLKALEDIKPSFVLVAFDKGKETFRHFKYKEYKSNRITPPTELSGQFLLLKQLLDAFGICYLEERDYEADDIIGTVVLDERVKDFEKIILTGDKDFLQLVDEKIFVWLLKKGLKDVEKYDKDFLYAKLGLKPSQIPDFKSLVGDASDNIKGVKGIGQKTAVKLLQQFQTIENLFNNLESISDNKIKDKLSFYSEQIFLSKELATIYKRIPLKLSFEKLKYLDFYNSSKVLEIFEKLEFKSLLKKVQNITKVIEVKEELEEVSFEVIASTKLLDKFKFLFKASSIAFYLELDKKDYHKATILSFSFSDGYKNVCVLSDVVFSSRDVFDFLNKIFLDEKLLKIVYDLKVLKFVLTKAGFELGNNFFDVFLASYLLNPADNKLSLDFLSKKYNLKLLPTYKSDKEDFEGTKSFALKELSIRNTLVIYKLYPFLREDLKKVSCLDLFYTLELPLTLVLAKMELYGIKIDPCKLKELEEEFNLKMAKLTEEIYSLAGEEFNINSPKQLSNILFEKLKLPVGKKTKTGYSTDVEVLEKLASKHKIVSNILYFRQIGKLLTTYIEGLKKELTKDNKIHTKFHQTITATGRLSSTEPNLQNIPVRLEDGKKLRKIFIPSKKDWVFLAADYSQIELRVLAHLSSDSNLVCAFLANNDIHKSTAAEIFDVAIDDVTPSMRRHAKAVNFGIIYGMSDYGLAQALNIKRDEAKEFISKYFETFPLVKKYLDSLVLFAEENGYVLTLTNRRRYIPEINSKNFSTRMLARRIAMNTPIQGSAADIIKYAMLKVDKALEEKKLRARCLLQIHDELVFELPKDEIEEVKFLVKEKMENVLKLNVPLKVEINVGASLYDVK